MRVSVTRSGYSLLLLAFAAFVVTAGFGQPCFAESLSGSAAEALMDVPQTVSKPAAKPRRNVQRAPRTPSRSVGTARDIHRSVGSTPAADKSTPASSARAPSKSAEANPSSKQAKTTWSAKGAINLDAITAVDGLPGLLLVGGPSINLGGANSLASGAQQAGIGSAIVWGIVGAVVCVIASMGLQAMQRGGGARPGSYSGGGLSAAGAVGAFILVGGAKLFLFPDHAVEIKTTDLLALTPVYSNEFGLHCVLPKDLIKAKMHESVEGMDIAVNVAGYRSGKNEMMVGYAHMPIDELIKAKQAADTPKIHMGMPFAKDFQNMDKLAFSPLGSQQKYYYFDVNKALDASVDSAAKRAGFKVSYRVPLKVQGSLPGREYEGTASLGRLVRGRIFIGYNNLYHAIVVGDRSFVNSNDGYKFLDSMDVH